MVLQYVTDCSSRIVKSAAILDAEPFRHGDLDGADVRAIPERFEHRIGEASIKDILYRFLAEIMIDSKNPLLGEVLVQNLVQLSRRGKIMAKRFLHDHACVLGAS